MSKRTIITTREVNGRMVEGKVCPNCGEWHPLSEFGMRGNGNYQSYCRPCQTKSARLSWRRLHSAEEQDTTAKPTATAKPTSTGATGGQVRTVAEIVTAPTMADIKAMMKACKDFSLARCFANEPIKLMLALKELGYDGELTYTEVHRIKISGLS